MSLRKFGAILGLIACTSFVAVPVAATAQATLAPVPVKSFQAIPITGTASIGKAFKGHFSVAQFVTRKGGHTRLGRLGDTSGKSS